MSSDLDSELDAWSSKRLTLVEKKANAANQMQATMKEVVALYELLLSEGL